jgi:hypothetical protein
MRSMSMLRLSIGGWYPSAADNGLMDGSVPSFKKQSPLAYHLIAL